MQRRGFLRLLALLGGPTCFAGRWSILAESPPSALKRFKLGVISDELSPDLEEALQIMKGFGLSWVEVRTVWGVYNTYASPQQVEKIKELLKKYSFRVSVVDTALYKCALPGTTSVKGEKDFRPYSEQMDLLKRAIDRAHDLGTDKLRVFAFWRVPNPEGHYPRISEELAKAAEVARASHVRLLLEDEGSCNVGNGHELARMLKLVPASNFGANWDVGNGYWNGEVTFPDGYAALDKKRIWHMHVKDVGCVPSKAPRATEGQPGSHECHTAIVGTGEVDLLGQFRALVRDGYQETMSLEPEVQGPGLSHQEATKRSLEGVLKIMGQAVG